MLCRDSALFEANTAAGIMGNPRNIGLAIAVTTVSLLVAAVAAAGDAVRGQPQPGISSLNAEQLRAAGIGVAHPLAANTPARTAALGVVLDATDLVSEAGEVSAAAAAEHSASAEVVRLRGLVSGGAGPSLKMLEAAQAEQARAQAQLETARARFVLHWGPIAALSMSERQRLIDAASGGRSLLLRADVAGRHSVGTIPRDALLEVDGLQIPGRVLGPLRQAGEMQSAALLIEVKNAPSGLGPGARVPVALLAPARKGFVIPRDAVLYDDQGPYVFKQVVNRSADRNLRYAPVKVTLLAAYGDGWLIDGVDDDDDIVVRGAGVLWSLQGMAGHAADGDEDD
jgi:hypothetical protein